MIFLKKTEKKNITKKNINAFSGYNPLKIVLICFIVIVVLLSCIIFFCLNSYKHSIVSVMEMNATLNVSDYVGFNLNKNGLHFGTIFPGGYSTRDIGLILEKDSYVYIITDDSKISKWIYVSYQNELLERGINYSLRIVARAPLDAPDPSDYAFKIRIIVLDKKANCVARMFFNKYAAQLEKSYVPPESGKVVLEIVNQSRTN